MSDASAVVMFQTTALDDTAIEKPRGHVHTTPTPAVAALFHRRANTSGTVGLVAQDSAVVVTHTGDPGSSRIGVDVPPGVIPIAWGRPKPSDCAVAVNWMIDSSRMVALTAAVVRSSKHA
jgi:hypothetical protein